MTGNAPARVLIVDAQPLFRLGLLTLLESAYPHWHISDAHTLAEIRGQLWEGAIDLLFIDSHLLGQEAAQGRTVASSLNLVSSLVAITDTNDPIVTTGCLGAGADATIARTDPISRTLSVVDMMSVRCDREAARESHGGMAAVPLPETTATSEILNLTARQFDVLRLLAKGQSNKVIARDLGLSVSTVKVHLNTVFRALGARNRVEAVVRARPFQESMPVS